MTCPRGDGELIARSATGLGSIPLTYHLCLACLGHWTRPFDANYLPLSALPNDTIKPEEMESFRCPECRERLERAHEDAMAPDILAWYCPTGHGYFFPRGNLRRFRMAQEARVTYHKLWNIPMPPIRSVLLATILLILGISAGSVITRIQQTQNVNTQARDILTYQKAIPSGGNSIIFLARTAAKTTMILRIDALALIKPLKTTDGLSHTILVTKPQSGTYQYYYLYEINGETIRSKTYLLTIP